MRPRVFVCPGVYGDDRRLARFRDFCAPLLDMVPLDLPALDAPARHLRSIPLTGAALARAIEALQPAGPVRLVGYSFGGNVAVEVARALIRQGRPVSLVLIDAYRTERDVPRRRTRARRLFWVALDRLCTWDRVRHVVLALVGRGSPERRAATERRMMWSLRRQATAVWHPQPIAAATLLVMSESFADEIAFWLALAPNAAAVRLPHDHWDILRLPAAIPLRDAIATHFA